MLKKHSSMMVAVVVLFMILLVFTGSALAMSPSSMYMRIWSTAEIQNLFHYNLNFCAVDSETGQVIEDNAVAMELREDYAGISTSMKKIATYSTSNDRGVFENVAWKPGFHEYRLYVNRVSKDYRIPTGYGTFDIKQDYAGLPKALKIVLKLLGKAAKKIPYAREAVIAAEFLFKSGVPTDLKGHNGFQGSIHSTDFSWYSPWNCYKWVQVGLQKKEAQKLFFIVPRYNESDSTTIPHLYDSKGNEIGLVYVGQSVVNPGEQETYPKFMAGRNFSGTVIPYALKVGEYHFKYGNYTHNFSITGVQMPRNEDGSSDIAKYERLGELEKSIIKRYDCEKYYISAGKVSPSKEDNDWTRCVIDDTVSVPYQSLHVMDETNAKEHTLVVAGLGEGKFLMEPPEVKVSVSVQYDSTPYASEEKLCYYIPNIKTYGDPTYLGSTTGKKTDAGTYIDTFTLINGKGSKSYDKSDSTGVYNALYKGPNYGGIEPLQESNCWDLEFSSKRDETKNIQYLYYTVHIKPNAYAKRLTIYPVNENETPVSRYIKENGEKYSPLQNSLVFSLTNVTDGRTRFLTADLTDRLQYSPYLEGSKTYQLKLIDSNDDEYKTDGAVWTIVTNADGSVKSFTPSVTTKETGRAKLESNGDYSVMLLYKNRIEVTAKKLWTDIFGVAVNREDEPADYVSVILVDYQNCTQTRVELRQDRNWISPSFVMNANHGYTVCVEKVLQNGETITAAVGWDDLFKPAYGLTYYDYDNNPTYLYGALSFRENEGKATLYLRNAKRELSFYKTNGITFVNGYHFKFSRSGQLLTETTEIIDGVSATKYTIDLSDSDFFNYGIGCLIEYDSDGNEYGKWEMTPKHGIIKINKMTYDYKLVESSGFRTHVELWDEYDETRVVNLLDNGVRRNGLDSFKIHVQKHWSEDLVNLVESVEVVLEPVALGTNLTDPVTRITSVGKDAGSVVVTLSAANGWESDVWLRKGVVYYAYESTVKPKDETVIPKYSTTYYTTKPNTQQTRTEFWTLKFAGESEEEGTYYFGNIDSYYPGALVCEENWNGYRNDTLHLSNESDNYHSFLAVINILKQDGVVGNVPKAMTAVLEELNGESGEWTPKTRSRVSLNSGERTANVYFENLNVTKKYRVRLAYEDETKYGIAENDCFVGSVLGYLEPTDHLFEASKVSAPYALTYDDSLNEIDNTEYITLNFVNDFKVYVFYSDQDNAGGKRPSQLSYHFVRTEDGNNPLPFGCEGVLTKTGSLYPNFVSIMPYEPTQYMYNIVLDGTFEQNGHTYLQVGDSPVYQLEINNYLERGYINIYLTEQIRVDVQKVWNIDAEDLDRPDSVAMVLQKYVYSGRIIDHRKLYEWKTNTEFFLYPENDWKTFVYADKYRTVYPYKTPEYRICELNADGKVVEEGKTFILTIPERVNKAGVVLPEHATLYKVNYVYSVGEDAVQVSNTALTELTLKKYWQTISGVDKMDNAALGLFAKPEGSDDKPTASIVSKGGVYIGGVRYGFALLNPYNAWKATMIANKYSDDGRKLIYTGEEVCKCILPNGLQPRDVLEALNLTETQIQTYLAQIPNFTAVSGEAYSAFNDVKQMIPVVNVVTYPSGDDQITVYKVWDDDIDHSGQTVEAELFWKGGKSHDIVLDQTKNWTCTLNGLGGDMNDYSLVEKPLDDYYPEYQSYLGGRVRVIVNHPVGRVTIKITKEWDDSVIIHPVSVDFEIQKSLWENGILVPKGTEIYCTLDDSNGWTMEYNDLPARDASGNRYVYEVVETKVDGRTDLLSAFEYGDVIEYGEDGADAYYHHIFTNKIVGEYQLLNISVDKSWDDGSGIFQDPVTLRLKATYENAKSEIVTETVKVFTLSKEQGWKTTFTVPKYDYLGRLVTYSLDEDPVNGYDAGITRTETDADHLDFKVENESKCMVAVLRYIGDGDGSTRPKNATLRLQKKNDSDVWEDVISGGNPVEKILPDPSEEPPEEQVNQYTAVFTDLEITNTYRVRLCYYQDDTTQVVLENNGPLVVDSEKLKSYQVEKASKGYRVDYAEAGNAGNPVQIITLNKLLDVRVTWLDNHNAGKTRPDSLPLTFYKGDKNFENWSETGHTDKVSGWTGDSGSAIFVMNTEIGYDEETTGRVRVKGEEKKEERILWKSPGGVWYEVKYPETNDGYINEITLIEQKQFSVRKEWDIDILKLDCPNEIEVRLETWDGSGKSGKDEPDGEEVETIKLSKEGTDTAKSWEGDFQPVDRYKLTVRKEGDKEITEQTEIHYRVRELYKETILTVETGRKLVAKPDTDVIYHVDTYHHPNGDEEEEHDTCYMVSYETEGDTTTITNVAVLDTTIKKFWLLFGTAKKPSSVHLTLTSRYKEAYREIVEKTPGIGKFLSVYTPMLDPISGDMDSLFGLITIPVTIGKATPNENLAKDWVVNFRIKKYGKLSIPMDFKGEELVSCFETTILEWLFKIKLPVGYNPIKGFISFSTKLFMITDTWGLAPIVNVWGGGDDPTPPGGGDPPGGDPYRTIYGIKIWNDNNNPNRPKSVTIHIKNKQTGEIEHTVTVSADTEWGWVWKKAKKNASYTVEEIVPSGYTVKYSSSVSGNKEIFTITNSRSPGDEDPPESDSSEYFVRKIWKDSKDHSGDTVHVRLYENGKEIRTVDLNADNNWRYTFKNLTIGNTYKATEDKITGYSVSYLRSSKATIIYNTPEDDPPTTENGEYYVRKIWKDSKDHSGDTVHVRLYADGEEIASVDLNAANNWKHVFTNLAKGRTYTASEDRIPGYGVTYERSTNSTIIYNKPVDENPMRIIIKKVWKNVAEEDIPESIDMELLQNGVPIRTVTLEKSKGWTVEVTTDQNGEKLPKQTKLGVDYLYSIREPQIPLGCGFTVSRRTLSDGYTIELTGTNRKFSFEITVLTIRKVWNENPVKEHDPVLILLRAEGKTVDTFAIGQKDGWSITRVYPLRDKQGNEIEYTIVEVPVEKYEPSYSYDPVNHILTVTNTPIEEVASTITVTNTIYTENGGNKEREFQFSFNLKNGEGEQFKEATIYLEKQTEKKLGIIELTEDGYSFTLAGDEKLLIMGVPEGSMFRVVETPTADEQTAYISTVKLNGEDVEQKNDNALKANVKNDVTIVAAGIKRAVNDRVDYFQRMLAGSIAVTKVWEDDRNDDVSFVLYRNSEKVDEYPNPTRSGDVYTFRNLPKFYDTATELIPIVWSVTEKPIDGYWTVYSNVAPYADKTNRLYNGGTVYNRPYITFEFVKIWSGGNGGTITLIATEQSGKTYTRKVNTKPGKGTYSIALPKYVGSRRAVYTLTEQVSDDVIVTYLNSGENEAEKNCIYIGGTIINTVVPKTGDERHPLLYLATAFVAFGVLLVLVIKKRKTEKE